VCVVAEIEPILDFEGEVFRRVAKQFEKARTIELHNALPSKNAWLDTLQERQRTFKRSQALAPERDQRGAGARADEGRDVVAHTRERIAAAEPSIVLVVTAD
jgi:hypothetical protein